MAGADVHNRLAPAFVNQILVETEDAAEAVLIAESVVFGILMAQAGSRRLALEWLDVLTQRVVERLPEQLMPTWDSMRGAG